ncbi:hypothetical protein [Escherichia coli]|uniref:hypothetical protein n=1 Tax=Escherichia coli TaxID=562 RepID=UPI0024B3D34F|nr:hypothetical protein [Escherichia coli]WHD61890.1 hypothetical protein QJA99_09215 [Escherichia coli]
MSDHRGETVTAQENGNPVLITQPGDYRRTCSTRSAWQSGKPPATPWDTSAHGEAWVTDTERQRAAELEVIPDSNASNGETGDRPSVDLINLKLRAGRSLTPEETAKLTPCWIISR